MPYSKPKKHKKAAITDIIGERGIALIQKISLDMGFPFQRTGFDKGIDGYIEIVDPATGAATNCIILIQSKATSGSYIAETDESFDFYCNERDLYYWLGGNAPVILICSRPHTNEAYWVSIKDYFNKDDAARKSHKVHFLKKRDIFDVNCRQKLIDLAVPKDSGIYLSPIPKEEKLISNLLTVERLPKTIFVAKTNTKDRDEVFQRLFGSGVKPRKEFLVKNNSLISFHDLEEHPWSILCDTTTIKSDPIKIWSETKDQDKLNDFVELLNYALTEILEPNVLLDETEGYYYFAPSQDLSPIELPYQSLKRGTSRWVFRDYRKQRDPTQVAYYRHSAFYGQFYRFENNWYLEITPHYRFTLNGYRVSRFKDDQLKKIKQFELNPAVLGQVVMWAEYLHETPELFTEVYPYLGFGNLVTFGINTGIEDDIWLKHEDEDNETIRAFDNKNNELPLFKGLENQNGN